MRWIAALLVASLALLCASLMIGPAGLSMAQVMEGLMGGEHTTIVRELRLPRTLLGFAVGALLALAGGLYQTLFRNPLADPFVVGVSGGAALGAVIATVLEIPATNVFAFGGGLATMLVVYRLASTRQGLPVVNLLLAGFAVGTLAGALIAILLARRQNWERIMGVLMGHLSDATWARVAVTAPLLLVMFAVMWALSRRLDILTLGEEGAHGLGVDVERMKRALFFAATLATATAVSNCGIVGFVGLVAPHIARLLVGPRHAVFLPAALLCGGIFLTLADIGVRTVFPGVPLSAVAALVGAPFFVYLLRLRNR